MSDARQCWSTERFVLGMFDDENMNTFTIYY